MDWERARAGRALADGWFRRNTVGSLATGFALHEMSVLETHGGNLSDGKPQERAVLVPLLLSIAKSSRAFLTLLLAEIGLHPGQDQLLLALQAEGTVSVSALAEQLAVRPSTVSKMLDRLIERGLVDRTASSQDARRTLVVLTAEGAKVRRAVQVIWDKLEADLRPSFEEAEFGAQLRMLEKVDALLAAKLRRLR